MRAAPIIGALFIIAGLFWLARLAMRRLRWVPACCAFLLGDPDAIAEVLGGER